MAMLNNQMVILLYSNILQQYQWIQSSTECIENIENIENYEHMIQLLIHIKPPHNHQPPITRS